MLKPVDVLESIQFPVSSSGYLNYGILNYIFLFRILMHLMYWNAKKREKQNIYHQIDYLLHTNFNILYCCTTIIQFCEGRNEKTWYVFVVYDRNSIFSFIVYFQFCWIWESLNKHFNSANIIITFWQASSFQLFTLCLK